MKKKSGKWGAWKSASFILIIYAAFLFFTSLISFLPNVTDLIFIAYGAIAGIIYGVLAYFVYKTKLISLVLATVFLAIEIVVMLFVLGLSWIKILFLIILLYYLWKIKKKK